MATRSRSCSPKSSARSDVLINNAGLGHHAPLVSGETAAWREMLELNVLALCVCTREAIAGMRRRGVDDGHIVHVSSMAGYRVPPDSGVYAATKHAVRALTESLRQELRAAGSGIRVGAISPGFVETEFAEHYHRSAELARQEYGRYKVLEPADIAEATLYLLAQPAHVQIHDILMRPTLQPT
jgi:17beta-estradiol 17-dehydrogenase / 3beta-hydroxysteroid 3-dehydrogenase